jgi:ubiquinone/menaquinone biosynthesis C-methylase UbiE
MAFDDGRRAYLLGETRGEHARLVRQAAVLNPLTERLFREAGIGPGQRILEIGSGVGEVALLASQLVGPTGAVVGVERDQKTLETARARAVESSLSNVTFVHADVSDIGADRDLGLFDAVVGRLIVEYLPNAEGVMRSIALLVRPGGVVAFQDACWGPWLTMTDGLPLRRKCVSLIVETFARSGAHMDMELIFYRAFQDAGLPAPAMRLEVPIGDDPNIVQYAFDLFSTLLPRMRQYELPLGELGDIETLRTRLEEERATARRFGSTVGLVSAWSRKPL